MNIYRSENFTVFSRSVEFVQATSIEYLGLLNMEDVGAFSNYITTDSSIF